MKFTLAIKKLKSGDVGRIRGHNERSHDTASQLPQPAWFDSVGHHPTVSWQQDRVDNARKLAKRKDAVVAISVVIQVGNQRDWRWPPTADFPEGQIRIPPPADMFALANVATAALVREFGEHNLVSIELHTDESTPHVQAVIVPVHQGKLQAKHWCGGAVKLSALRKRLHEDVSMEIPCEYTPGQRGGEPHRSKLAAGGEAWELVRPLLEMFERHPEAALEASQELVGRLQELDDKNHMRP